MSTAPVVYVLTGDDEVGIGKLIKSLRDRLGDRSTADMNTTIMKDAVDLGELKSEVQAVPFLSERRLVILEGALRSLRGKKARGEFQSILDGIQPSTALVILEEKSLKTDHWLVAWARANPERVFMRSLPLPRGRALVRWVIEYVRESGAEITPQAAEHLVSLIGDDNRLAAAEAEKLMAYVGYKRAIEVDDVDLLTAPIPQADVFKMVDALGAQNGGSALSLVRNLLEQRPGLLIFGMIVRQFRLLLLYKEMELGGQTGSGAARRLGLPPFVLRKLAAQAKNFGMRELERHYRRLGELDEHIKSGRIPVDIAMSTFIAEVTSPHRSPQ